MLTAALNAFRIFLLALTMASLAAPAGAAYLNGQLFDQMPNARQLPEQLKTSKPGGATAVWLTHVYDARRKLSAVTDSDGAGDNEGRSFTYDPNGRLLTANGPWGTGSYLYDALRAQGRANDDCPSRGAFVCRRQHDAAATERSRVHDRLSPRHGAQPPKSIFERVWTPPNSGHYREGRVIPIGVIAPISFGYW